jgi:hypothetical protein
MIAYTVNRSITSNVPRDSPEAYEVAVVDTAGNSLMAFSRAIRLAWSPAGDTLAVAISRAPGEMLSTFDSIVVWTPHGDVITRAHVSARRGSIGWAGPDTVLAGSWVQGPVDAIPLKTGIASVSKHRGTSVSADALFSIYPTMGGLGIGVYEDRTGANFAYRSVELLELPRLGEIGPARWVSSTRSAHALAISACPPVSTAPFGGRRGTVGCLTALVEVGTLRLLGWTRGRLIGLSASGREAVVDRDSSLVFLGDGDWDRGPVPKQPYARAERRVTPAREPHRPVLAFTTDQIRCCDNAMFVAALGYHPGLVYMVEAGGRLRALPNNPPDYWASEAELNRTADLIAIAGVTGDSERTPSIFVMNTSGAVVEHFKDRARFRWSRDGTRLALIGSANVAIWDRRKGLICNVPVSADDEAWAESGALMLRSHNRVVNVDPQSGDTTLTRHMAVDVSPNGQYSIDGTHFYAGPRVFDDRMQANITRCGWGEVGDIAGGLSGDPFWSTAFGQPHHLWVNRCDPRFLGLEEGRLAGCDLALIDVDQMKLVDAIEGKLVGRTVDGHSVVVLRGNKFSVVSLESQRKAKPVSSARERSRGRKVLIQAVVLGWSSRWVSSRQPAQDDTVGVYRVEAQEGDWLPDWSQFHSACGRGMRLRKVSDDRVEIEYSGTWLGSGVAVVTPGKETRLTTNSRDGGFYLHLRLAR